MYTRYHEMFSLSSQNQISFELHFNDIFKAELIAHLSMLIHAHVQTPEGSPVLLKNPNPLFSPLSGFYLPIYCYLQ